MSLRALNVSTRTAAIGAVALVGFAAVGAVSLWADAERSVQAEEMAALRERNEFINRAAEGFLNARRREKDFLIRLDPSYADKHGEVAVAVVATLGTLADQIGRAHV